LRQKRKLRLTDSLVGREGGKGCSRSGKGKGGYSLTQNLGAQRKTEVWSWGQGGGTGGVKENYEAMGG